MYRRRIDENTRHTDPPTGIAVRVYCSSFGIADGTVPDGAPHAPVAPLEGRAVFQRCGHFQHDGTVQGESRVDLRFTVDQINDVFKSLGVQDAGGGRISTVSYGSRDPIMKTLGSFGIYLTSNPTLGQLLDQIRGEAIKLATPNSIKGTIIGVERKQQATHEEDGTHP